MTINWSFVIYGIPLITAILSPVITTILTNHHQAKMWKKENYTKRKIEMIESYVRHTGAFLKSKTCENLEAYGTSSGMVFLYIPQELWPLVTKIDTDVRAGRITQETHDTFSKLCQSLSGSIVD